LTSAPPLFDNIWSYSLLGERAKPTRE